MAPLDQLRHDHSEYLRQTTGCENALSLREQAGGSSGNCGRGIAGDKNKRRSRSSGSTDTYHDNSDSDNGDNSNDNDNSADEDSGGGEGDDEKVGNSSNGQDMKHLYNAPSVDYAHGDELFPANQSTTATALTTIPTTTAVTSPVSLAASASSVSTFISTFFPTSMNLDPIVTSNPSLPITSSRPRKDLDTDADPTITLSWPIKYESSSTISSFTVPETALGSITTTQANPGGNDYHDNNKHNSLTPTDEHLLVAAGVIGGFIMIIAGICLVTWIWKNVPFSALRRREIHGGDDAWFGRQTRGQDSTADGDSRYPIQRASPQGPYGFLTDEKPISQQHIGGLVVSPVVTPKIATARTAATPLNVGLERQDLVHGASPGGAALYESSQSTAAPEPVTQPVTQPFYYTSPNYPLDDNGNTNTAIVLQNTSDVYDRGQREANHLSYLSSLSSGFGDAQIIIPEPGPTSSQIDPASQQNSRQSRKFSWATSIFQTRRADDRDTVYTTASVESAPRFRTINSWVAQQTGRLERQQRKIGAVPNMPEIQLP